MDFNQLIYKRQSVRQYTDKKVEREKIDLCLEAGRMAPSACNSQPWTFVVIDDDTIKEQVASATYNSVVSFNKFSHQAPVIVAVVMESVNLTSKIGTKSTDIDYGFIDLGIAVEHFCLQAADIGLGTCILGWFQAEKIKKILEIPKNRKIGLLITLGYAKEDTIRVKNRKQIDDMSFNNKYCKK
ncbi:MAG: nitroreductase family protein [Clostridia bacterium]|nr:nitroreductase family protein [Clostridia bacterium]